MESLDSRRLARRPRPLGRRISREDCGVESLETLGREDQGCEHLYSIAGGLALGCEKVLEGLRRRTVKSVETRRKRLASDRARLRGVWGRLDGLWGLPSLSLSGGVWVKGSTERRERNGIASDGLAVGGCYMEKREGNLPECRLTQLFKTLHSCPHRQYRLGGVRSLGNYCWSGLPPGSFRRVGFPSQPDDRCPRPGL